MVRNRCWRSCVDVNFVCFVGVFDLVMLESQSRKTRRS